MNKFMLINNAGIPRDSAIIKLGDVGYHFELLNEGDFFAGGGLFFIKEERDGLPVKEIYLHGSSSDYGKPKFDMFNSFRMDKEFKGYRVFWLGVKLNTLDKNKPIELTEKITYY